MERFWSKVDKTDGCWLWTAYRNGHGYGKVSINGTPRRAHRVAWELTHGEIPEGMDVLHSCDNPPCVNPAHLHLGTHTTNMREMFARKRRVKNNPWKVTADQVREIRARYAAGGTSYRKLAVDYGVHAVHIGHIVRRVVWRSVP
jgi:hypothetical protein